MTASTSFRRHVPTRFLIHQCQIITFLILKSDNIESSRIELKGKDLQVPSNQSYNYYYFTLQLGTFVIFSSFHIDIEGKGGWIIAPTPLPPPPHLFLRPRDYPCCRKQNNWLSLKHALTSALRHPQSKTCASRSGQPLTALGSVCPV